MHAAFANPSQDEIRALLKRIKTIAVVGLSASPGRASHGVARALQGFGYRIIPVNPTLAEVLGEKAYPNLRELPEPVDLVDVFRESSHVAGIVEECIALKLPALWLQDGVVDEAAARRARDAGLTVIMDRCIYRDYARLM
ncbi:MAG: CoA-binding protein [Candidatus Competibacteraceae bacterium]|nr:CoA-binding protein [Candidatus Competibacteraceae bacterium]MBK8898399.1 CoA-binding protein [Candidatus Competibacteraceae bacterium]MBK8962209.1 CoA-binding protein [Candidatus Competibacteraceae bacterium]